GAEVHAAASELAKLLDVVGNAAADAAQRERRADDRRETDVIDDRQRFFERARDAALRNLDADLLHRIAEEETVFGDLDRVDLRANQLDVVFGKDPPLVECDRQIESRLTTDGGQHRIRLLFDDDGFSGFRRERL